MVEQSPGAARFLSHLPIQKQSLVFRNPVTLRKDLLVGKETNLPETTFHFVQVAYTTAQRKEREEKDKPGTYQLVAVLYMNHLQHQNV